MKKISPVHSDTVIDKKTGEWVPKSFEDFLSEITHIESLIKESGSSVVFRGHRKRNWLLDSTFVRSCKTTLFGVAEDSRLSERIVKSVDLHLALLNLFLLKFGVLVRPSNELDSHMIEAGIDPWFELMKRIQQHPEENNEGPFRLRGTNLLDWTESSDVAMFFANEGRDGDGAVYVCDATATGKTLQIIPVGEILEKMKASGNAGNSLGIPLMFHPRRQVLNQRAKNQKAIYFAQMDLRYDLESVWKIQEQGLNNETIILKLVLPAGTEAEASADLLKKGITKEFIYPAG